MDLACNMPYLSLHYWNGDYEQKTLSDNQSQNIQFLAKLATLNYLFYYANYVATHIRNHYNFLFTKKFHTCSQD